VTSGTNRHYRRSPLGLEGYSITPRHVNLRQIEAFKAVIENGTVSRAAEMLHICNRR